MKTLDKQQWETKSDHYLQGTLACEDGRRIRLTVRNNFYNSQSYAKSELWTHMGWTTVYTIPGELLSDSPAKDIDKLKKITLEIIDR